MFGILRSALIINVFLIAQIGSLFWPESSRANCDIRTILENSVIPPKRSLWFDKTLKIERFDHEAHYHFREIKTLLPIQDGSIAQLNPETIKILREIQTDQLFIVEFEKQFEKFHKRLPNPDDYLHFYQKRIDHYSTAMSSFIDEFSKTSPTKAAEMKETVDKQIQFVMSDFKKALVANNFKMMDQVCSRISGSLTELQAAMSVKGLEKVSLTLKDKPQLVQKLDHQLKNIQKELERDSKAWDRFAELFPKVMNNTLVKHKQELPTSEKLKLIREWVLSKEVDVVRSLNGKTRWIEVKSNFQPFSVVSFSTAGMGQKSYLFQIRELKDILRFLKIDHEVELEYFATGGMTDDLTRLLHNDGIRVIDTK